ncbi:hypothetical protein VcTj87_25270 [Vibrio comitans]
MLIVIQLLTDVSPAVFVRRVEHLYLLQKQESPLAGALVNQENRLTMNACNDSMIELKLVAHSQKTLS